LRRRLQTIARDAIPVRQERFFRRCQRVSGANFPDQLLRAAERELPNMQRPRLTEEDAAIFAIMRAAGQIEAVRKIGNRTSPVRPIIEAQLLARIDRVPSNGKAHAASPHRLH